MENRKIVFLCSAYPKEFDDFYRNLSGVDSTISGNIHSSSIIDGLKENGVEHFIISGVAVGHYPLNTKTKKLPEIKFSDNFYAVAYNNHVLVNQASKAKSMYRCYKKNCHFNDEPVDILLADIHEPFLKTALKIKRKNKNSRIVNICLDVPDTIISSKEGFLRRFLKKISVKRNMKLLEKVDGFVLLSDAMRKRLPVDDKPYLISPFIADVHLYEGFVKNKNNKFLISYCGVLSTQYNIDLLLDAFSLIKNENVELLLAGKGDGVSLIKSASANDCRIKYLGELTRNEAIQLQLDSDVLVNPRLPENNYTSYSFPSKTISYLLSGNPLVCYTFSSFPDDIKKMVFEPKETNASSLAETIMYASNKKSIVDLNKINSYSALKFIEQLENLFSNIRNKYE